ncbi:hypothetical protein JXB02_04750 [Candidatus Woesearchaeota archaeon]|nr:hypothetical protein [Candidatus Woesearchaeota archaeon]
MRFFARNKDGSLQLSVNAIVVLVLGITMLGLGLAFTKGMFGKLQGKLEVEPPNIPATADEPVVVYSDTIKCSQNKDCVIPVNIYNDATSNQTMTPQIVCATGGVVTATPASPITGIAQTVPAEAFRSFKVVVEAADMTGSGSSVCTIGAGGGLTKQIVVQVS